MTEPDWADVVSASDIASMLGVSRAVVSNWVARHGSFPEPLHAVAGGRIKLWSRAAVTDWHSQRA